MSSVRTYELQVKISLHSLFFVVVKLPPPCCLQTLTSSLYLCMAFKRANLKALKDKQTMTLFRGKEHALSITKLKKFEYR